MDFSRPRHYEKLESKSFDPLLLDNKRWNPIPIFPRIIIRSEQTLRVQSIPKVDGRKKEKRGGEGLFNPLETILGMRNKKQRSDRDSPWRVFFHAV